MLACSDGANIDSVVQELSQHFKLRDLGPTTQLLGIQIHRDCPNCPNCHISISHAQFITNLLEEHGLSDAKPLSTPFNPGTCLSTSMSPRIMQKCLRCNITPIPHLLVHSCIWQSPQDQTLPMQLESLPDSIPIQVWLTGKLQGMSFTIWRVQLTTSLFISLPHHPSNSSLTQMLIMVEIQTMASDVLWWLVELT